MAQTIAVTGGNGKLGKAVLSELATHGYETVSLDRGKRGEEISSQYIELDLLDTGNVYSALAQSDADAIAHMGTIPGPGRNPGYEVYESNVMSTYYVLEAASALGINKVCIASSINVMGAAYQSEPIDVRYLPVDEDHPLTPQDPYAISKHAMEVTADGFGRKMGTSSTISVIRYPFIATTEQLTEYFGKADRSLTKAQDLVGGRDELFTYIHINDAARVTRKALEAKFVGNECFWAVSNDTTLETPTDTVIKHCYPGAEKRGRFAEHRSLVSTEKAHNMLNWKPRKTWRK